MGSCFIFVQPFDGSTHSHTHTLFFCMPLMNISFFEAMDDSLIRSGGLGKCFSFVNLCFLFFFGCDANSTRTEDTKQQVCGKENAINNRGCEATICLFSVSRSNILCRNLWFTHNDEEKWIMDNAKWICKEYLLGCWIS